MKFKKALTLQIQHCVKVNIENSKKLVIARATNGSRRFEILDNGSFFIGSYYGSIQLSSFSLFGIFWKIWPFSNQSEKMYCVLLFCRKCSYIDVKCVFCWNLQTHVQVKIYIIITIYISLK